MGPIAESEKGQLRTHLAGTFLQTMSRYEEKCASPGTGPGGTKTMADLLEEMELLLMAKRHEAEQRMLENDDYLTTAARTGDADNVKLPPGFLRTTVMGAARIEGKRVDVVFGVDPADPIVAPYKEEVSRLRGLADVERVEAFNALTFEERRVRYEGNIRAIAALRDRARDMSEAQRREFVDSLMPDFLPGEWVIDDRSYFARLR